MDGYTAHCAFRVDKIAYGAGGGGRKEKEEVEVEERARR